MRIKKPHVAVRILLGLISFILCIALFCTAIASMLVVDLQLLTNKDNLQIFISQVLFGRDPKKSPVILPHAVGVGAIRLDEAEPLDWTDYVPEGWQVGDPLPEGWTLPEGYTLPTEAEEDDENHVIYIPDASDTSTSSLVVEYIYGYLYELLGDELPVTKTEVEEYLHESSVPDFVSEKMASMASDIFTGESTTTITEEEILVLVVENKALVETILGETITDQGMEVIASNINDIDLIGSVQNAVEVQLGLKDEIEIPVAPDSSSGNSGSSGSSSGGTSSGGTSSGSSSSGSTSSGSTVTDGENTDNAENGASTSTPTSKPVIRDNVIKGILSGVVTAQDVVDGGAVTILALLREVAAPSTLMTLLGICAGLILLLFAVNYWKMHAALRSVGIVAMVAALPFLVPTVLITVMPALFADQVMSIVALVLTLISKVCISVFIGGAVLVIGSIVWGCLRKRSPGKAKTEPSVLEVTDRLDTATEAVEESEAEAETVEEAAPEIVEEPAPEPVEKAEAEAETVEAE